MRVSECKIYISQKIIHNNDDALKTPHKMYVIRFTFRRTLRKRSPLVPVPYSFGDDNDNDIKDKKKKKKKKKKLAAAAATATTVALASSGNPIPGVGSTIPLVSTRTGF